jgi:hypothetical protein
MKGAFRSPPERCNTIQLYREIKFERFTMDRCIYFDVMIKRRCVARGIKNIAFPRLSEVQNMIVVHDAAQNKVLKYSNSGEISKLFLYWSEGEGEHFMHFCAFDCIVSNHAV